MRLQFLHHPRTAAALQEIRGGSGVVFEGPDEGMFGGENMPDESTDHGLARNFTS